MLLSWATATIFAPHLTLRWRYPRNPSGGIPVTSEQFSSVLLQSFPRYLHEGSEGG